MEIVIWSFYIITLHFFGGIKDHQNHAGYGSRCYSTATMCMPIHTFACLEVNFAILTISEIVWSKFGCSRAEPESPQCENLNSPSSLAMYIVAADLGALFDKLFILFHEYQLSCVFYIFQLIVLAWQCLSNGSTFLWASENVSTILVPWQ